MRQGLGRLYHFAWDEFCDWYLELAKVPLARRSAGGRENPVCALFVLDQLLRLLHPFMPFVTEELWTALTGEDSVMVAPWPAFSQPDPGAEAEISSLMRLVTEVRRFRSDQGLRPSQRVAARLAGHLRARRWPGTWEKAGYFAADADSTAPAYCIVIPPPNVTGSLHIGHALDHTLIDALIRRRRMQGYNTLWLPGMDHAGIATQNVVERELAKEGLSRHDLGREAFVARVWQWKAESGGKILGQMRRLGDSVDWSRERFTMDAGLSRAVQTIFKQLYDDGLIYRAERIINWCPRCLTALSDIEVDHSDDEGELTSIRYGVGDDAIVVATTRPETMLGDTAVAVHPDDPRYARLVGHTVELPLTGRRIPIIADDHVDPTFGTGAVKVTPAHDPNDFEIGRRHDLPSLTIMDEHGVITAHGPFQGLDRFEARPAVVAALREEGRIVAEVRPVRARRRPLQPLRHHGRAAPVAAVVRPRRPAGQGGRRRGPRRPRPAPPAGDERPVLRLGRRHARLVHQPSAVVGPPYSSFLWTERPGALRRPGRASTRGVVPGP